MVSLPFHIIFLRLRTTTTTIKVEGGGRGLGAGTGPLGRECKAAAATEFEDVTGSRAVKANRGLRKNDLFLC